MSLVLKLFGYKLNSIGQTGILTSWWCLKKSQGITIVIRQHHLGTIIVKLPIHLVTVKILHWIGINFLTPELSYCNLASHHPVLLQTLTTHSECCSTACLHLSQILPVHCISLCIPVAPNGCSKSFQNTGDGLQNNKGQSNSITRSRFKIQHSNTGYHPSLCLVSSSHPLTHGMIFWPQKQRTLPPFSEQARYISVILLLYIGPWQHVLHPKLTPDLNHGFYESQLSINHDIHKHTGSSQTFITI